MRKLMRISLIVASVCTVAGLGFALAGYVMGGEPGFWVRRDGLYTNQDLRDQNAKKLRVLEKTKIGTIESMDIQVDYNDIVVKPSGDENCYLEYRVFTEEKEPEYAVDDGTLTFTCIQEAGEKHWGTAGFFVISYDGTIERGLVTVYVPERTRLDKVTLYTSSGDISYEGPDAGTIDITSEYGDVELSGADAGTVRLTASSGEFRCTEGKYDSFYGKNEYGRTYLRDIDAGEMTVESSSGGVTLKDITAVSVVVKDMYGDVECSAVKAGDLTVSLSSGGLDVREADIRDGNFENQYGDVRLELTGGEKDYNYDLSVEYGEVKVNNRSSVEHDIKEDNGADRNVVVSAENGLIRIITE